MVAADFQALLVALLLLERDPETGRYPARLDSQAAWLLPMVEAIRQTVITFAQEREIDVVATNSDGSVQNGGPTFLSSPWRWGQLRQKVSLTLDSTL